MKNNKRNIILAVLMSLILSAGMGTAAFAAGGEQAKGGKQEGVEKAESTLVIDILPIEADVVKMMDNGVEEEEAVVTVADDWADKIYQEEITKDPAFSVSVADISQQIQNMLWEMGEGDIEAYETPERGLRFRSMLGRGGNDENPSSAI